MERFDESGEWVSPAIELNGYVFHYNNTKLRMFSEQWSFLNHVEWRGDDGVLQGVMVSQDFYDTLMENDYAYEFQFFPDDQTVEWYAKVSVRNLDEELDALIPPN